MLIVFNPVRFRELFPAFQCTPAVSDADLQIQWDTATLYITNRYRAACCGLSLEQRTRALYLMTAHLAQIARLVSLGQTPGIMSSATVDKVSVTLEPPKVDNQWQYWLQSTPYGQQLLALLQVASAGGCYYGGKPELAAFRRPNVW